tara:strand:- start:5249 stop:5461 length:213 start_codon:yes stop_codon:yes gene_type:complete
MELKSFDIKSFDKSLVGRAATVATSVALVSSVGMLASKHNKVGLPENVYTLSTFSMIGSVVGAWLWYRRN